ncbi:MAG: hypothetical protein LBF58_02280 [Deltaproteobacteria bacterium]|jgi:DNA-directed RNA polymerase subunit RPC12/RpoP|nr:hypothetical protein [Deltaproteobacteria bacterium]
MDALTHITCPGCGADVELKPGQLTVTCPYCDNKISLVTPREETPLTIEFMVPVGADKAALTSLAHSLMIAPDNVPDDILDNSKIEEATFCYVPCFMGQGKFDCHWSATFGFDRQEPYTDYVSRTDSNGRTRQVPVTRYRTVTDWRPASGTGSAKFLRMVSAADPKELGPNVPEMLQNTVPFQPIVYNQALMGGYPCLDFAYSPDQGGFALENMVQNEDATVFAHKRAQGDRQRDWTIDAIVTFDGPVKAGFIPLAKFAFSYEGKKYNVWAEGTKLGGYLHDAFPVDKGRSSKKAKGFVPLWVTLGGVALIVIGTLADVLPGYESGAVTYVSVAALFVTLLFGIIRSGSISGHSKRLREASFAAKQLELTDATNPRPDEERRRLLEKSQKPVKPFFAKTEDDGLLLPIMSGVCLLALIVALIIGRVSHTNLYEPSHASTQSTGDYGAAGERAPGPAPGPIPVPDPPGRAEPAPSQAASLGPDPSAGPDRVAGVSGEYSLDELFCPDEPPEYCLAPDGPANGVVYSPRKGRGPGDHKIEYLVKYRDGLPEGVKVYFDKAGDVTEAISYRGGKPNGLRINFHPSQGGEPQKISRLSECRDGRLDGLDYRFDRSGEILSVSRFRGGAPEGESVEYYPDGSVRTKSRYSGGNLVGQTQSFSQGSLREPPPEFTQMPLLMEIDGEATEMISTSTRLEGKVSQNGRAPEAGDALADAGDPRPGGFGLG